MDGKGADVELVELVDEGIALTGEGRPDLRRRLEQTRRRLLDPDVRVMVVGEFKQGKSLLVNALVNAPVCPVDDDVATSVPTVVRHGERPSAVVVAPPEGRRTADDGPPARVPVPLEELAAYVSERGNPGNERRLLAAEVSLPRAILADGLTVVDSPGVGGLESAHSLTTLTALPSADVVLLVSDASQEYTEPEMRFLRQAMRVCPNVACVVTKTDIYPEWRRIVDLDRAHLAALAPGVPLFPVSSVLRLHAAREQDRELNEESGFPALVRFLRQDVLGHAERLTRRSVGHDLVSTADNLRLSVGSELHALQDPGATAQLILDLEEARAKADDQRRRSARWQLTLSDGMTDLIADMEHDLRDRMRSVLREAEEAIDRGDPGPVWDQFSDWFEQRTASAVSDTFVWTDERSQWLARRVADHFSLEELRLPDLRVGDTEGVLDPVEPVPFLDPGHLGAAQRILVGMRGSYGGILMFGLLTGMLGMSLVNPLSVGAGLLIGTKAYREDRETRLRRRQAEAKTIVRRATDDVIFQVGKQLKDRLRLVQRAIRDHFTELAEEHHRTLTDSVQAAQKAASTYAAESEARIRELRAELARVEKFRARAVQVGQEPAPAGRA
ncbi:replication fork clamp-binding protein CrfC [Georgenia soli]|uniref:Replication fork clamp-binding protein CrfC n=1 Tax=Georgenia soli TaxID=638953 RepID=A0A2A9EKF5_9MICO|nr:dynamin family protein [Georgenia soli]PFG38735.1 replication fork clamp-binding protein CrfC [Georgenia soli]